jgi:hypothetical protein
MQAAAQLRAVLTTNGLEQTSTACLLCICWCPIVIGWTVRTARFGGAHTQCCDHCAWGRVVPGTLEAHMRLQQGCMCVDGLHEGSRRSEQEE